MDWLRRMKPLLKLHHVSGLLEQIFATSG
ncbi:hypothetical protein PR048_012023 [Dryococelus australis]|uniref:Uncharacterized protein n=1 Tax=Dryococelus australis TaxID=614101 RepID=A0ABQ9HPG4_9NEOP|nr:hypothetical protein PR048_012023 [Dryococelus australis]